MRAKVEHLFHVIKNLFRHRKTRYRGLTKNTAQLFTSRGALIRMFEVLQSSGLRPDNPARRLAVPKPKPVEVLDLMQTCAASDRWREVRQVWIEQPEPEIGFRDPLARIVVAEWSYWTALRRSELAALNRYLIADGLTQRVPFLDLCTHVRSKYAASSLADSAMEPTIASSLARLAAARAR